MSSNKRLFVDNLPEFLKENDLREKFNQYGSVLSVEIKERKTVINNQTPHFAYVQINIDNQGLDHCFNDFYNEQWEGYWVTVQEAKESFMERLKREREEQKANTGSAAQKSVEVPTVTKPKFEETKRPNVKRTFDDTQDDPLPVKVKKTKKEVLPTLPVPSFPKVQKSKPLPLPEPSFPVVVKPKEPEPVDPDFIIKNNKGKKFQGKIEGFGKEPVGRIDHSKKKPKIESEADKKRLEGLSKWRQEMQQKKAIMKKAISSASSASNKKIKFDEEPEEIPAPAVTGKPPKKSKKIALFENNESEAEDDGIDFQVKEQFQGKKGQKLLDLQSKYKYDKRFVLDERFMEEGESDEENEPEEKDEIQEEKNKEFEILESVLGKSLRRQADKPVTESKNHYQMMVRYDPTLPDHERYEVKKKKVEETKKETTKKRQQANNDKREVETLPQEEAPQVSKEKFSKVNLENLGQKTEFSFASMFDKVIEERGVVDNFNQVTEVIDTTKQARPFKEKNPFRYDSSSSEDEEEEEKPIEKKKMVQQPKAPVINKLSSEPFFFKEDDYRLQEADDFIKAMASKEHNDFDKTRRRLKEIVRAKIRHNIKLNRPFKRKLGGKKRRKFKKALKR